MARFFNKKALKEYIQRRVSNVLGLSLITSASMLITLLAMLKGYSHTDVLIVVTALLIVLCGIQFIRARRRFRTIRAEKPLHARKKKP